MDDVYSDLPKELLHELTGVSTATSKILSYFEDSDELSINDVLIKTYRKDGIVKKRIDVNAALYRLVKKGFLEQTKRKGVFRLTSKGKVFKP